MTRQSDQGLFGGASENSKILEPTNKGTILDWQIFIF